MKNNYLLFYVVLICLLSACKKPSNQVESSKGFPTPKGTTVGNPQTATIGANGGTLTSSDGIISVTIPAGAVNNSISFSIQPITNNTPNGLGLSYRLLPEGIHFEQPVTIRFHYNDQLINGSLPNLLLLCYQDGSGIWQAKMNAILDTQNKTISVQSSHFSDWSICTTLRLQVDPQTVQPGSTAKISAWQLNDIADLNTGLIQEVPIGSLSDISSPKWSLIGPGALATNGAIATYTAPTASVTNNIITVNAEIDNVPFPAGRGIGAKIILVATIYLDFFYMDIVFDGQTYHIKDNNAVSYFDPVTGISTITGQVNGIQVAIGFKGNQASSFFFGEDQTEATVSVNTGGTIYTSFYMKCDKDGNPVIPQAMPGSVHITHYGDVHGSIEGDLEGTLVYDFFGNCTPSFKPVSGKFVTWRIR